MLYSRIIFSALLQQKEAYTLSHACRAFKLIKPEQREQTYVIQLCDEYKVSLSDLRATPVFISGVHFHYFYTAGARHSVSVINGIEKSRLSLYAATHLIKVEAAPS